MLIPKGGALCHATQELRSTCGLLLDDFSVNFQLESVQYSGCPAFTAKSRAIVDDSLQPTRIVQSDVSKHYQRTSRPSRSDNESNRGLRCHRLLLYKQAVLQACLQVFAFFQLVDQCTSYHGSSQKGYKPNCSRDIVVDKLSYLSI